MSAPNKALLPKLFTKNSSYFVHFLATICCIWTQAPHSRALPSHHISLPSHRFIFPPFQRLLEDSILLAYRMLNSPGSHTYSLRKLVQAPFSIWNVSTHLSRFFPTTKCCREHTKAVAFPKYFCFSKWNCKFPRSTEVKISGLSWNLPDLLWQLQLSGVLGSIGADL